MQSPKNQTILEKRGNSEQIKIILFYGEESFSSTSSAQAITVKLQRMSKYVLPNTILRRGPQLDRQSGFMNCLHRNPRKNQHKNPLGNLRKNLPGNLRKSLLGNQHKNLPGNLHKNPPPIRPRSQLKKRVGSQPKNLSGSLRYHLQILNR